MKFKYLNSLGAKNEPFLFITDFKAESLKVYLLKDIINEDIEFKIEVNYNYIKHNARFLKEHNKFQIYKQKFDLVQEHIKNGDTYLLNLTQPTKIKSELSLKEIYSLANAHYKLRYKDQFVCFSPESFIKIKDNQIHTYPMKGTIDSSVENAKEKILTDAKEMAEHIMVVDLLRNDLSIVAQKVKVEKFRYIQTISAGDKELIQVSSHISGELSGNWHERIGDILSSLLPAGSISGTPKKKTIDIIQEVEGYNRGYFSGVFGVYDGKSLDSGVMIRFVEKQTNDYIYKSGGGITCDSNSKSEYDELLDKIYLP